MRHMTKPMAIPSPRALARKDTTPKTKPPKRGVNKDQIATVRARGTDTSNLSAAEMAEVISPDKPLTDKQKLFVHYWSKGDSIQSASLRAGYSDGGTVAYRLVKMPNVLALKAKFEAQWEASGGITRQKVMDGMLEAIDMARMEADPTAMIAGWREIGKICGYYAPVEHKVKVDVTGNVIVNKLNSLSDAELLQIIQRGAQPALPGP